MNKALAEITMNDDFYLNKRVHNGLTYENYLQLMQHKCDGIDGDNLFDEERKRFDMTQLNIQRSGRIQRTYQVPDFLNKRLSAIHQPQLWMVLTETWCGDSAQNLPYINKFAQINPNIKLRLLHRDENLDIMDRFLSNQARGIPILVAFDVKGATLFKWGPRPQEAAELFIKEKSAGLPKDEILKRLHLWYGRNRGKAIEQEFYQLLATSAASLELAEEKLFNNGRM